MSSDKQEIINQTAISLRALLGEMYNRTPEELPDEMSLVDGLYLDSMDLLDLVFQIEGTHSVKISADKLRKIVTMRDLIEHVATYHLVCP